MWVGYKLRLGQPTQGLCAHSSIFAARNNIHSNQQRQQEVNIKGDPGTLSSHSRTTPTIPFRNFASNHPFSNSFSNCVYCSLLSRQSLSSLFHFLSFSLYLSIVFFPSALVAIRVHKIYSLLQWSQLDPSLSSSYLHRIPALIVLTLLLLTTCFYPPSPQTTTRYTFRRIIISQKETHICTSLPFPSLPEFCLLLPPRREPVHLLFFFCPSFSFFLIPADPL